MARSKRKNSDQNSHGGRSKKYRSEESTGAENTLKDDSVFGQMVTKAGIVLKAKNKPNEIKHDLPVFLKALTQAIKRHADQPRMIADFMEGLRNHIEDLVRFRWALMPTLTSPEAIESSASGGTQETLIRMIMGVDQLQLGVMNMLLEKLAEFSEDDDPVFDDAGKVNMSRLIMNQFRWLDKVVNSKELLSKMFEILSVGCVSVQHEIIACMPEVVDDLQHADVAKQLSELLVENNQLAVPILDALSNLTLKPELLSEVRGSVTQTLPSADVHDMPVIVKFLLQTTSASDALEVVCEIRKHLDFEFSFPPESCSTPHGGKANGSATDRCSEVLVVDTIRSAMRFQRIISEAWLKAIEAVKSSQEHRVIDFIVLSILHASNYKKPVESLFRNKIRNGQFTEVLLQLAFASHIESLKEYFPSVLSLAETLLRSPEPSICNFACAMYRHAFSSHDTFCRQEIVGNLVTHIGSGFAGEIDSSLDILSQLVEKYVTKMAPFAIFIKGVLDYLDNLNVAQIRKLYSMLSALAFRSNEDEGMVQDDMHIIIRKQLTNNVPKYQRMGVIGAIMIVKNLAYNSQDQQTTMDGTSSGPVSTISDEAYTQVINLLQLVRMSSGQTPEAASLFMDELSAIIHSGRIDPKVEAWIAENVISDFQDDYVVDIDPSCKEGEDGLPWRSEYGLDDEAEGAIAVNIVPLLGKSERLKKQARIKPGLRVISPVCLSPHFRLLQICESRQQNGDLEGIDALLGCPLFMPQPEVLEKMDSLSNKEKEMACDSSFYAVNWFREIVNAFASQGETEMKAKVITRLQNITTVQKVLENILSYPKNYIPPAANFDCDDASKAPVNNNQTSISGGKRGRKAAGKGKKKPLVDKDNTQQDNSDESRDDTLLNSTVTQESKKEDSTVTDTGKSVDLTGYRQFFRELDFEVFSILKVDLINRAALDSEMNTAATTRLQLQPSELEFLLDDLCQKLKHILPSSANKRRTFLKTKVDKNAGFSNLDKKGSTSVLNAAIKLLPALCDHLEGTSAFFQALVTANDGMVDGPGYFTEEAQLMASCYHYILQCLLSLLSWNGFLMPENQNLLKDVLSVLAARGSSSASSSQLPIQELVRRSFQYLGTFSQTTPTLVSAVTLCKLQVSLCEKCASEELTSKIATQSQAYLKREWLTKDGEKEKGAKYNEQIQILLKLFFGHSVDVLSSLEDLCTVGIPELLESDKNGCSPTYPTLTRHSYSVFYRTIHQELIDCVKTIQPSKQTELDEVKLDKLIRWNLAVRLFHILVNLMKAFDARVNLGAALKYGRQFVETFLRLGMPMLDHMFRPHKEEVQSLLKNLQLSTRALHHMCGHSKIMKDVALTNQIPLLKKVLESFVYRVKTMLAMNKCSEAFWLGNLKNRDIRGEEILSQAARAQEEQSDTESLPDDDEDSEVELEGESVSSKADEGEDSGGESYSETF